MESIWPNDILDSISHTDLKDFVFLKKKTDYSVYRALLASSGTDVRVKVLTATSAELRERFIQEAALFKLLKHKNIPDFIGVSTLPPNFSEVKESKDKSLALFITRQPEGQELSSYLLEKRSSKRQNKNQKRIFYDGLLNVLLDVADALHYLHTRRPAVIYRAVSMGHIAVVQTESGIGGSLTNLNCVMLQAENKRKVTKVGIEAFEEEALNNEDMLTGDFFKETLMCTRSSLASPRRTPQIPLEASTTVPRKKATRSAIPKAPSKATRKGKQLSRNKAPTAIKWNVQRDATRKFVKTDSAKDAEARLMHEVQKHKESSFEDPSLPLKPLEVVDAILEDCVSFPSPADSGFSIHAPTEKGKSKYSEISLDSPSGSPSTSTTTTTLNWSRKDLYNMKRSNGHDSASSSKWSESAHADKSLDSPGSDAVKSRKQMSTDSAIAEFSKSPSDATVSEQEAAVQRENSIEFLKRTVGESNLAPELLVDDLSGTPGDVFSFGLVIYSCLTKMVPVPLSAKPGHSLFNFSTDFPSTVQNLIMDCCKKQPEMRPSMEEVRDRLQEIKESGCVHDIWRRRKPMKRLSGCFGRF